MRIILIGAPGAGKTAVAQAVKKRWREEVLKPLQAQEVVMPWWHDDLTVEVLDDYEKGIEGLGLEVGEKASFRTGVAMHFEHMRQREGVGTSVPSIACGSGLERLAHSAAHMQRMATSLSASTPQVQAALVQEQGAMPVLSMLMMDAWEANYAFYLPLVASTIITPTSMGASFATTVDLAIQDAMGSFGMEVQVLQGDDDAKASEVIKTLVELEPKRVAQLKEAERGTDNAD